MQLWGLDAPVAAFCWAMAYAALQDIPMITSAPLLLLTAAVWLFTIASRLFRAVVQRRGWYVIFYRSHMALFTLLVLAVAAATLWMLFYYVGQILLLYAFIPFVVLVLGYLPLIRRVEGLRGIFHASAFALACSVPAVFYSVFVSPLQLISCSPTWYLAILMFLYYLLRSSWLMAEDAARRRGLLVSVVLGLLFLFCLLSAASAPSFERSFCLTVATGAACLELLVRLRPRLSQDALFSVGWLSMALPPVLGVVLFD